MAEYKNGVIRTFIILFSFAGMVIMAYLLYQHYAPMPDGGAFCDLGEGLSCNVVNKSGYSELFGIPMAGLGVFYFALVFVLGVFRYSAATLTFIALFLVVLLGPSLYLSFMSKTVLGSMCILCESSKALMALIVALSTYAVGIRNIGYRKIVLALALAIALASAIFFFHSLTIINPFSYEENISLWEIIR